jgi:hypothetical protein
MNSEFLAQARAYKNELISHLFGQPESSPTESEKLSILQAIPEGSNIVGVGFGHKVTQGSIAREEPVIRVYVKAKLLESELSEKMKIPKEINGIPTDVIEVGEVNPHSTPCGVSVSHQSGKPGTIGCLVRKTDGSSNADFLLSNNHIFANFNTAKIGDFIVQPAISDGGTQVIAQLTDFQVMNFSGAPNFMDAAIAQVFNAGQVTPDIKGIGNINPNPIGARVNQSVRKNGRTTGLTMGIISDPAVDMMIPYVSKVARLEDHIMISNVGTPFSQVGDSGSLVVDSATLRPVGLLAAGGSGFSLASPIGPILQRFNIALV